MSLHLAQANCSPSLVMTTTTTSGRCYVVSISTSFKFNPFHYLPHFPHFLFLDLFFDVPSCRLLPIFLHHYWKHYHFLGKDLPRLLSVERWRRIFLFQFSSQAFVKPVPSDVYIVIRQSIGQIFSRPFHSCVISVIFNPVFGPLCQSLRRNLLLWN